MIPQAWMAAGVLVLLATTHGYAYMTGSKHKDNEYKAALLKAQQETREVELKWQGAANAIVTNLDAKRAATQRSLDIALNGLRDRSDRHLPDDPRVNCKGASGAELSREDGEFLAGEAARADNIRAGLVACYAYIDALK